MKVTLKKNVSRTGKFRDANGWFVITRDQIDRWVETFKQMQEDNVVCPIVLDHKEEAEKTVGKITNLYRDGDYMVAIMEFPDQEKADLTTTNDVSIRASGVYHTGQKTYHDAIRHIALCPLPLVTGLGEYELCCSLKDRSNDEPDNTNTETNMEKLLKVIANILGKELPAEVLTDVDKAIEWVKDNFPVKTEDKADASEDKSDETKSESNVVASNDSDKKDVKACNDTDKKDLKACTEADKKDVKACNNTDSKDVKACNDTDKKDLKACAEADKKDIKACNDKDKKCCNDDSKKDIEASEDSEEKAKVEDEKEDKVDKVSDIEKIKNEADLKEKTKDIACSINAARERELRSFLGQEGVTAEKVGNWIDKYARSENLDICCSLQDEYTSLIEGLSCNRRNNVFRPNTHLDEPRDYKKPPEGPQMQKWYERMSKRKNA